MFYFDLKMKKTRIVSLVVSLAVLMSSNCRAHYTDQWAVQIKDSATAERVARDTHCIVEGKTLTKSFFFRFVSSDLVPYYLAWKSRYIK